MEAGDAASNSFSISATVVKRIDIAMTRRKQSGFLIIVFVVILMVAFATTSEFSFDQRAVESEKSVKRPAANIDSNSTSFTASTTSMIMNSSSESTPKSAANSRNLSNAALTSLQQRLFDNSRGNATFVQNKTIYGAIIMTDYGSKPEVNNTTVKLDNVTVQTGKDKLLSAANLSAIRSKNSREMISQLPFPVVHWPPLFLKACPYSASQHKGERGLLYAHYQIWLDFVYFDHDVLEKSVKKEVRGMYENSASESGYQNGTFVAAENGSLYKNGSPYRNENIIVIFEDDADIAVVDLEEALRDEFNTMTTDLLFLGWCVGRAAKPVPLCTHAYALTLEGARKAIKYIEPCGRALDEQFVIIAKNKWITYREAHHSSYKNKFNSNYPKQNDGTFGIFHQKKMGSFNGH